MKEIYLFDSNVDDSNLLSDIIKNKILPDLKNKKLL